MAVNEKKWSKYTNEMKSYSFDFLSIPDIFYCIGQSFNQPKFCPDATWNPNATTFANSSMTGSYPLVVFLDKNNTIYLTERYLNRTQIWSYGNTVPIKTIGGLNAPIGLFVTKNGDIYIDNGYNGRVEKWTLNATTGVTVMSVTASCHGLFVDINDTLYCSMANQNKVVKIFLNSNGIVPILAAGNGSTGSASNMLYNPSGLFVDLNFNLYVADCDNDRVQLFQSGQLNGTTIAGATAPNTITLYWPSGIMLDADGYLFIVENAGHRIVVSGSNGFRCLVGCSGVGGISADHLQNPFSFSFDTDGNMFVSDQGNSRLQKFSLATNSCGKYPTPL